LPAELCLHIFSFLDLRTLCAVAKVCRWFRHLAMDPFLFREISLGPLTKQKATQACEQTIARFATTLVSLQISSSGVEPGALHFLGQAERLHTLRLVQVPSGLPAQMFGRMIRLETLSMLGCPDLNGANLLALSVGSRGLRSLEFGGFKVDVLGFGPALTNMRDSLTTLRLEASELPRETLIGNLPVLGNLRTLGLKQTQSLTALPPGFWRSFPALTDLDLNRCSTLVPNDLLLLADDLTNLLRLDLGFVPAVTNEVLGVFAERLVSLRSLSLNSCAGFDNIQLDDIGHTTPFPSLRAIALHSCPKVGPRFLGSLGRCSNLEEVDLSYVKVTDEGIYVFFSQAVRPSLKVLNLSSTNVTNATLGLVSALAPNLRQMHLCFCKIEESGVISLAFGCQRLEVLNLRGCGAVTDDCLFPLFQGLRYLRELVTLGTKIKNSSITKLRGSGSTAPFFA